MKLSNIKLGTVVNIKGVADNATVIARRSITNSLDTLVVWQGKGYGFGWPLREKLWFDQITEQYSDPATWPNKYDCGYWISSSKDEIDLLPKKLVSKLQLGDVINTEYIGKAKNGIVIGLHKSGDALIGWKETSCEGSDMSCIHAIESQTHHPDVIYLNSVESVRQTYTKAKWISREEMAEVIANESVISKVSIEKDPNIYQSMNYFMLGNVVNVKGVGSNATLIGRASNGDVLLGFRDSTDCEMLPQRTADVFSLYSANQLLIENGVIANYPWAFAVSQHAYASKHVAADKKETSPIKDMTFIIDQKMIEDLVNEILVIQKDSNDMEIKISNLDIGKTRNDKNTRIKVTRNKETSPSSFGSMLKQDTKDAAYRIASTQITRGIKVSILTLMKSKGSTTTSLTALSEMLETEWGTSLLAYVMGIGLQQTSFVKDTRVAKMAEEMRVYGMSITGNTAFEGLMEYMMPVITEALSGLSKQETEEVRIATSSKVKATTVIELDENDLIEEPNETLHLQSGQV